MGSEHTADSSWLSAVDWMPSACKQINARVDVMAWFQFERYHWDYRGYSLGQDCTPLLQCLVLLMYVRK